MWPAILPAAGRRRRRRVAIAWLHSWQLTCPHPPRRRLVAPVTPTAQPARVAAPLPPHPAATASNPGTQQQRSPAAAALLSAADAAASMLLLPVSMLQTARHAIMGPRAGTAAPSTPETAGPGSQQRGGGSGSGRRAVHYGLGYGECSGPVRRAHAEATSAYADLSGAGSSLGACGQLAARQRRHVASNCNLHFDVCCCPPCPCRGGGV